MRHLKVLFYLGIALLTAAPFSGCAAAQTHEKASQVLANYLKAPDKSYQWKDLDKKGNVRTLALTSLTWQGHVWKHKVVIVNPAHNEFPGKAMLMINVGGRADDSQLLSMLAHGIGATVVGVSAVPNQPLFGRSENELLAYSFERYLQTRDDTWPALLPMTKSVIKAMDAVQAFTKNSNNPITKFIVGGASKRGWTTWLVGAEDKRVIGIVPIVYDNLNLPAQMKHQKEMLGKYSQKIAAFTKLNLPQVLSTSKGKTLARIVDPYYYRDKVTMPKLIVNGSNDPYWTVDSLNLYYNDLKGPKNVFYVPNGGHTLGIKNRQDISKVFYILGTIQGWVRQVAAGKTPSATHLAVTDTKTGKRFSASATGAVNAVLWVAHASTKDFHHAKWLPQKMTLQNGKLVGDVATPKTGYVAAYAQLILPGTPALPMRLSTPMTWWGAAQ